MIDDFAKQDIVRGVSLDDVFARGTEVPPSTTEEDEMMDALTALMMRGYDTSPAELDGYYVYKIIAGDRHYYPAKGTLRTLNTGWIIFQCALAQTGGAAPIYYTLPAVQQQPVYQWLKEEEPAEEQVNYGLRVA